MTGKVLDFNIQENSGVISGIDGNRYKFTGAQWKSSDTPPAKGLEVDFDTNENGEAVDIFVTANQTSAQTQVNVTVPQTAASAIVSLVFGIIGLFSSWWLFGIPSIVAVITGHMARSRIKASEGKLTGAGLALAGLILGYIEIILFLVTVLGLIGLGVAGAYDTY